MDLPDYFIADLPPDAVLTPTMIREACQTLKHNRESYLATRSTPRLVRTLSQLAEDWMNPADPFRQMALHQGPAKTGFPLKTLSNGLDAFFSQINPDQLRLWITQELGHLQRLDGMTATAGEVEGKRSALVNGPELITHITAGNIPCSGLMSLVTGLITHSAQFIKCASGTSFLLRLFAHSLHKVEPKLASCIEIAEWRGGNHELESVLFEESDCVTATGSDETLEHIRKRLPLRTRFLGYGHKISFAYISRDVLFGSNTHHVLAHAATDILAWNQLGCLSPHLIYVEQGGAVPPEEFARLLSEEMARREQDEPRGAIPMDVASTIASRRSFYEIRAAHSEETRLWHSPHSTDWTVVYETDPLFSPSCLHRFVHVKSVSSLTEALHAAEMARGKTSTVGLAALEDKAPLMASELARWGATRICPLGKMQRPPLTWRHDGRPSLADRVTWTDWEQ